MKQQCCECGASIRLTHDVHGHYDAQVMEAFDWIHQGPGHGRVTAGEANMIRHNYNARVARGDTDWQKRKRRRPDLNDAEMETLRRLSDEKGGATFAEVRRAAKA